MWLTKAAPRWRGGRVGVGHWRSGVGDELQWSAEGVVSA
jgi:hypothetical protein